MATRSFSFLLLLFLSRFSFTFCDVGTASRYGPPYIPTDCFGQDSSKFPANNLFAAAGDGIWDNGAACGREYLVRCLSSSTLDACIMGKTIRIVIVDHDKQKSGNTMILSENGFQMIANPSSSPINIEFQQV